MALKIAFRQIAGFIEEGEDGQLQGAGALLFQNFHRSLFRNVSFILTKTEEDTLIEDGSYIDGKYKNDSTFVNMFRRKEADIIGMPLEYGTSSAYAISSCPVLDISGAALHAPRLSSTNINVLNTLKIFPLGIIYGILGTLISLTLILRFTGKVKLFHSTSSLAQCLINQTNVDSKLLKCGALILAWLFCSFAITKIYEQSINADCVTLDYSSVVENVMDLDRHKSYNTVFVQGDYIREQFKRSQNPVKSRIWNRKNKLIAPLDFTAVLSMIKTDHVIVGCIPGIISVGQYSCGLIKDGKREEVGRKYLISQKGFGSSNTGLYYRVNLTKSVERLIWFKSLTVGQAGLAHAFLKQGMKSLSDRSPTSSAACLHDNKEDLYDDVQTLGAMKISNFSSLLNIFIVFLALSVTLFIVERTLYCLQIVRQGEP